MRRWQRSMSCTHPVTERAEPLPDVLSARGERAFAPVNQMEHPGSPFPFIQTWSQQAQQGSPAPGIAQPDETLASPQELCFLTVELLRGPSKGGNIPMSDVLMVIFWQRVAVTSFLPLWAVWTSNTSMLLSTPHTGDDVMLGPTHCPPNVDVLLIWAGPGHEENVGTQTRS